MNATDILNHLNEQKTKMLNQNIKGMSSSEIRRAIHQEFYIKNNIADIIHKLNSSDLLSYDYAIEMRNEIAVSVQIELGCYGC